MRIFLLGFMGAGKSTLGKQLALSLKYKFVDLDKILEEQSGMSIPEIFLNKGEAWFRAAESNELQTLGAHDNIVVATGGGTPCHNDNLNWMLDHGQCIYLKCEPNILQERLSKTASTRPLLANTKEEALQEHIEYLLRLREDFYEQAQFIIEDATLEKIEAALA